MKIWRPIEGEGFTQGHTENQWQRKDCIPGLLTSGEILLSIHAPPLQYLLLVHTYVNSLREGTTFYTCAVQLATSYMWQLTWKHG